MDYMNTNNQEKDLAFDQSEERLLEKSYTPLVMGAVALKMTAEEGVSTPEQAYHRNFSVNELEGQGILLGYN